MGWNKVPCQGAPHYEPCSLIECSVVYSSRRSDYACIVVLLSYFVWLQCVFLMCGVGNRVGHSGGVTCDMLLFYHHLWTRCVSKGPKHFFFFFLQFRRILPTPSAFNCRWLPFRQSQGKFPWAEEKCLKFQVERQLFFHNFAPPGVYFLIKRDARQASHSHLQNKSNMLVEVFFCVFF